MLFYTEIAYFLLPMVGLMKVSEFTIFDLMLFL